MVKNESEYAFESIIKNIGHYGPGLDDVMPGAVIASPSKTSPNYYYQVCYSDNLLVSLRQFYQRS